eukprot:3272286-Rhodomonas_salina.1
MFVTALAVCTTPLGTKLAVGHMHVLLPATSVGTDLVVRWYCTQAFPVLRPVSSYPAMERRCVIPVTKPLLSRVVEHF